MIKNITALALLLAALTGPNAFGQWTYDAYDYYYGGYFDNTTYDYYDTEDDWFYDYYTYDTDYEYEYDPLEGYEWEEEGLF